MRPVPVLACRPSLRGFLARLTPEVAARLGSPAVIRARTDQALAQLRGAAPRARVGTPPRSEAGPAPALIGYAVVFNRAFHHKGEWRIWQPGAFATSLRTGRPVDFYAEHDRAGGAFAGTEDGTLRIWEDAIGLAVEVRPGGSRSFADLAAKVEGGEVNELSVGSRFIHAPMMNLGGHEVRMIERAELIEVSACVAGAAAETVLVSGRRERDGQMPSLAALHVEQAAARFSRSLRQLAEVA